MRAKDPQISFSEELHCDGLLSTGAIDARLHGFSISRNKYHHSAEIRFSARLNPELAHKAADFLASTSLRFLGKYGDVELIAECVGLRSDAMSLEGLVTKLDIGVATVSTLPARQIVHVQFTPTDIAQSQVGNLVHYDTGEIKAWSNEGERHTMVLETPFGRGTFVRSIDYENASVQDVRANVQIPVPALFIEVAESQRTVDAGSLAGAIAEHLVAFEALVSYLSRRQVRWTEIDVISTTEANGHPSVSSARRCRTIYGSAEPANSLIWPARLGERDLDSMLRCLLASPYRQSLELAIDSLNAHWGREFIESKMANAFTAFETLVNGIDSVDGSDITVNKQMFNTLRTRLKDQIKAFATEHGLNDSTRTELYAKLSELHRRPFVPRAVGILRRYEIWWQDLWLPSANLEEELSKAYGRRGRYVHAGRIDNYHDAMADADRFHTLSERLLYELFDGKQEWLHPAAYPIRR